MKRPTRLVICGMVVFCGTHILLWKGVEGSDHFQAAVTEAQKAVHEKLSAPGRRQVPSPDSSSKEWEEGEWVIAEAVVQLADDMTVQEARSRSRNEARRKAIEKAVGIFVKGTTVVYNYVLAEDLVQSIVHGLVTDEQILEEGVREVGQQSHERATLYVTKLKARVRPVQAERKAEFSLKVMLNQTVFREGEDVEIRVSSDHDVYVHLFNIGQDDSLQCYSPTDSPRTPSFVQGNYSCFQMTASVRWAFGFEYSHQREQSVLWNGSRSLQLGRNAISSKLSFVKVSFRSMREKILG